VKTKPRQPEAEASGRPSLTVRDEDREAIADALAELLLARLEAGVELVETCPA
jgi:hypothetical protein